ncbi:MAG TPA: hypothetical protein VKB76_15350 [Ktedonobacterales bacterium]|nr:hypothetical protein [Ktedonobacterales bacterium]
MDVLLLSAVMLLGVLCNFAQMAIWAALFMFLGEAPDFATALYHCGVNLRGHLFRGAHSQVPVSG